MKYVIAIATFLLISCTTPKIPQGFSSKDLCSTDYDCTGQTRCRFVGVDTYAVCVPDERDWLQPWNAK